MKCVHNFAHPMSTCSHCISAGAPRFPPDRRRSPSQSLSTPSQTSAAPAAEPPVKPLAEAKAAAPTLSRGPTLPAHLPANVGLERAPAGPSSIAPSQSPSKPLQSSSSSTPRAPGTCGACGLPTKGHTPATCAETQAAAKLSDRPLGYIAHPCARCPNVNTRRPDSPLPEFCKSCHGNATKRARIALGRHEVTDAEVLAELAKPYDPEAARRLPGTSKARKARAEAKATRPKVPAAPPRDPLAEVIGRELFEDGTSEPVTLGEALAAGSLHGKVAPAVLAAPDAPTRDGGRLVLVEVPAPPTTDAQAESVTPACAPEPPAGNAERTAPEVAAQEGYDLLQYAYKASMNGEPVDRLVPLLRVALRLCSGETTVDVVLPEVVLGMLDTLLVTGLWGTTRAAALERLACERLRDLARDGILVLK